ncbi:MAG: secondary thiamine-phosphate synthase enzyme YjbQ [Candidatus Bathyarchaeia archaeon]
MGEGALKSLVEKFTLSTAKRVELIDITDMVEGVIRNSGVKNGLCLIAALHSTAAIIINEHEEGLLDDIIHKILETFPEVAHYRHDLVDDNAYAHLASVFLGPSKSLLIKGGRPLRGVWQNIFLLELDGPRRREIAVGVFGD